MQNSGFAALDCNAGWQIEKLVIRHFACGQIMNQETRKREFDFSSTFSHQL
jgi:hypothetical protein